MGLAVHYSPNPLSVNSMQPQYIEQLERADKLDSDLVAATAATSNAWSRVVASTGKLTNSVTKIADVVSRIEETREFIQQQVTIQQQERDAKERTRIASIFMVVGAAVVVAGIVAM